MDVCWNGNTKPSQKWGQESEDALAAAQVGVLLVSPNFLASEFLHDEELPYLLTVVER